MQKLIIHTFGEIIIHQIGINIQYLKRFLIRFKFKIDRNFNILYETIPCILIVLCSISYFENTLTNNLYLMDCLVDTFSWSVFNYIPFTFVMRTMSPSSQLCFCPFINVTNPFYQFVIFQIKHYTGYSPFLSITSNFSPKSLKTYPQGPSHLQAINFMSFFLQ